MTQVAMIRQNDLARIFKAAKAADMRVQIAGGIVSILPLTESPDAPLEQDEAAEAERRFLEKRRARG